MRGFNQSYIPSFLLMKSIWGLNDVLSYTTASLSPCCHIIILAGHKKIDIKRTLL